MPSPKSEYDRNLLLAALEPRDRALLKPHLTLVELKIAERLSVAGKAVRHVYFPVSGMISLVHTHDDGSTIEVGLIGREGFDGLPLLLGADTSSIETMVQGSGAAYCMPARAFTAAINASPRLKNKLLRYAYSVYVQAAISAACNGKHKVTQRLARWLLEVQDRLGGNQLSLSHEFIGYMLGIRRAGVTAALAALRDRNFILPGRGEIRITNRKGIESVSCECYRRVKSEYLRLSGGRT